MLIYEKRVAGVRHLFGTMGDIPSADDLQLTYKGSDGQVIADVTKFKFFYEKALNVFANESTDQLPGEADTEIKVYLGDELIIGTAPAAGDGGEDAGQDDKEQGQEENPDQKEPTGEDENEGTEDAPTEEDAG